MARYTGPVCRLCRRAGEKLFLKGERCFTPRCAVERRHRPPGALLPRRRRMSDHGARLREKQRVKQIYGVLEQQFRGYFEKARSRPGVTGNYLMQTLERRLDNVIYRLGFGDSRKEARQLVRHAHFLVDDRRVNIPSYLVQPQETISWRSVSKRSEVFKAAAEAVGQRGIPQWLALDTTEMTGRVLSIPEPAEIDTKINTRLIVEFYSR